MNTPTFEELPAFSFVGPDDLIPNEDKSRIGSLWGDLFHQSDSIQNRIEGTCYGISHDVRESGFRYMAAFAVSAEGELPTGFTQLDVPASRYAVFEHEGDVTTFADSIGYIFGVWLPASGENLIENHVLIERYGPGFNGATMSGDIQLMVSIK